MIKPESRRLPVTLFDGTAKICQQGIGVARFNLDVIYFPANFITRIPEI